MLEVNIIERVKDYNGRCIAYKLQDISTGEVFDIDSDDLNDKLEIGEYLIKNAVKVVEVDVENLDDKSEVGEQLIGDNTKTVDLGFRPVRGAKIKTTVCTLPTVTATKFQAPESLTSEVADNNSYYGSQFISICRRIRRLAVLGRIDISSAITPHQSNEGNNIHLVKLIESCGVDIKDFLVGYLSVLQPYSLDYFERKKTIGSTKIWMCDVGYRVKLLIKIHEEKNGEGLLISFHESTIRRSTVVQNLGRKDFSDKPCAVILDKVYEVGEVSNPEQEGVFTVQRGFMRLQLKAPLVGYFNGVGLIDYSAIVKAYQKRIDGILNELQIFYAQSKDRYALTIDVRDVSFLSSGYSTTNYICLLLDCFIISDDNQMAIVELANNILSEMPVESTRELRDALLQKYGVGYKNELYSQILYLCDTEV